MMKGQEETEAETLSLSQSQPIGGRGGISALVSLTKAPVLQDFLEEPLLLDSCPRAEKSQFSITTNLSRLVSCAKKGLSYQPSHGMLSMSYPGTNQVSEDEMPKSGNIFHRHSIWSRFWFTWTNCFSFFFFLLKPIWRKKLSWQTVKGADIISLQFCIRFQRNCWAHVLSFVRAGIKHWNWLRVCSLPGARETRAACRWRDSQPFYAV